MEEFETLTINLQDYFSGSLLDYKLVIDDITPNKTEETQELKELIKKEAYKTIKINSRWDILNS